MASGHGGPVRRDGARRAPVADTQGLLQEASDARGERGAGMIARQVATAPQQVGHTDLMGLGGELTIRGPAVAHQHAVVVHAQDGRRLWEALAYYSGWRKNEILGLTWDEIDEAGSVIRLAPARSKTLMGRILPISPPIAEALARRRARRDPDSPLVFHRDGIPVRRWRTAWRTACQAAGVPTRSLHDRYIQCIFLESNGYKESP